MYLNPANQDVRKGWLALSLACEQEEKGRWARRRSR